MNLAVFAYNFPHKHTQDFLLRLFLDNLKPQIVLAQNKKALNIPPSTLRVKPKHVDLLHPVQISERLGFNYCVVDHESEECIKLLQEFEIDIGVIAGARILKKPIGAVEKGIINFHPGLIPNARGLDALQWAIYENQPIGLTAHVIDHRIDAGYILRRITIPEYRDDTLIDLNLRLWETQNNILTEVIKQLASIPTLDELEYVEPGQSKLHRKMPPEIEQQIPELLRHRLSSLPN